jgi:hypothetical protein
MQRAKDTHPPSTIKETALLPEPHKVNAPVEIVEAKTTTSSLPVGFYDDVVTDMTARGVDMKKLLVTHQKQEETELSNFFDSVKETVTIIIWCMYI